MRCEKIKFAAAVLFFYAFFILDFFSTPNGASVNTLDSNLYPSNDSAGNHSAYAGGNITEVSLVGYSTTQSWQGYYGNVSGTIQLVDSNRKVLYN